MAATRPLSSTDETNAINSAIVLSLLIFLFFTEKYRYLQEYTVDSLLTDTSIRQTPLWNGHLARVVQTLDSTIHRINHYPADKYWRNQLRYSVDSDLSSG